MFMLSKNTLTTKKKSLVLFKTQVCENAVYIYSYYYDIYNYRNYLIKRYEHLI